MGCGVVQQQDQETTVIMQREKLLLQLFNLPQSLLWQFMQLDTQKQCKLGPRELKEYDDDGQILIQADINKSGFIEPNEFLMFKELFDEKNKENQHTLGELLQEKLDPPQNLIQKQKTTKTNKVANILDTDNYNLSQKIQDLQFNSVIDNDLDIQFLIDLGDNADSDIPDIVIEQKPSRIKKKSLIFKSAPEKTYETIQQQLQQNKKEIIKQMAMKDVQTLFKQKNIRADEKLWKQLFQMALISEDGKLAPERFTRFQAMVRGYVQ